MAGAERAGVVELVGRLEGEGLHALERALGDAGQRAGGRELQDAGDAEVTHGLQAQVPAHRAGDLADHPGQHVAAVVDDLSVAVGDDRDARVERRHRLGQAFEAADGGLHVHGVEGAGDAERDQPGLGRRVLGEGVQLLAGAGRHDLTGPVVVGRGQPVLVDGRQHLVAVTTQYGGHAGRRGRGGLGHRLAPLADQHHGLLRGDGAGDGGGCELADAVTGDGADLREQVARLVEQRLRGHQAGGHQERLGDLGVADGVGVGLRAVVGQVDAGHRGEPVEARREGGVLEPGREEAGGLGTLSGCDDDEHPSTLPCRRGSAHLRQAPISPGEFCRNLTSRRGGPIGSARPDCRPSTNAISNVNASRGMVGVKPVSSPTWRSR